MPLLPLLSFTRRPEVQPNLKNWLRLNMLVGFLRERVFLGFMSGSSSLPLLDRCQELTFPDGHTIQAEGLVAVAAPRPAQCRLHSKRTVAV